MPQRVNTGFRDIFEHLQLLPEVVYKLPMIGGWNFSRAVGKPRRCETARRDLDTYMYQRC